MQLFLQVSEIKKKEFSQFLVEKTLYNVYPIVYLKDGLLRSGSYVLCRKFLVVFAS